MWWTFAGTKANNSLVGALASTGIAATSNPESVTLASVKIDDLRGLASLLQVGITAATVDRQAVDGLKFSAALPLIQAYAQPLRAGLSSPSNGRSPVASRADAT